MLGIEETAVKHLALLSIGGSGKVCHRHMARGTLVLYSGPEVWIAERFEPNRRLPIGIASGIGHHPRAPGGVDGDVSARLILHIGVAYSARA